MGDNAQGQTAKPPAPSVPQLEEALWKTVTQGKLKDLQKYVDDYTSHARFNYVLNSTNEEVDEDGGSILIHCVREGRNKGSGLGKGGGKNHAGCLELLVKSGVDVNGQDKSQSTALIWAVSLRYPNYVGRLLKLGADVQLADQDGITAFQLAVQKGYKDIVNKFMDHDIKLIDLKDAKGLPPLVNAVKHGQIEICRLLLEKGADVNTAEEKNKRTPVYYAIRNKRLDLLDLLIRYNVDVETIDSSGHTILHLCCESTDQRYFQKVILYHPKFSKKVMDQTVDNDKTALILACQRGNSEQVKYLLEEGASVKDVDGTSKSSLHYCADNLETQCAELLLDKDASIVDYRDEQGYTALALAVLVGNVNLIKLLLDRGADINTQDNEGHKLAHWAAVTGHLKALDVLIYHKADLSSADNHQAYPIHYAAQMNSTNSGSSDSKISEKVLRKLLDCKVQLDVVDDANRQPLIWAACSGNAESCRMLLKAGVEINALDKDDLTAMHCAASRGHYNCIEVLRKQGADVNLMDKNKCTPLFYAITLGNKDCTRALINAKANVNHVDDRGRNPVHCAAIKGCLDTIKLLEKEKADLWHQNNKGDYPIHEAAQKGHLDVVKYLLRQKNDKEAVNVTNHSGKTLLHIGAATNNLPLCNLLVGYDCNMSALMKHAGKEFTPYDLAVIKNYQAAADLLKNKGALPHADLTNIKRTKSATGPDNRKANGTPVKTDPKTKTPVKKRSDVNQLNGPPQKKDDKKDDKKDNIKDSKKDNQKDDKKSESKQDNKTTAKENKKNVTIQEQSDSTKTGESAAEKNTKKEEGKGDKKEATSVSNKDSPKKTEAPVKAGNPKKSESATKPGSPQKTEADAKPDSLTKSETDVKGGSPKKTESNVKTGSPTVSESDSKSGSSKKTDAKSGTPKKTKADPKTGSPTKSESDEKPESPKKTDEKVVSPKKTGSEASVKTDNSEKSERTDKAEKADKSDKTEKSGKPGHSDKAVGIDKAAASTNTETPKSTPAKKKPSADSVLEKADGIRTSNASLQSEETEGSKNTRDAETQKNAVNQSDQSTSTDMGGSSSKEKKETGKYVSLEKSELNAKESQQQQSKQTAQQKKSGGKVRFPYGHSDNEDSGNETDSSRPKRAKKGTKNRADDIQKSVRLYQTRRNTSRGMQQLKRAQMHTAPMHDIVMFSRMMDNYRRGGGGEEDELDLRTCANWDGYLNNQLRFMSNIYREDSKSPHELQETAKEYHQRVETEARNRKKDTDTRVSKMKEKNQEREKKYNADMDREIDGLARRTAEMFDSVKAGASSRLSSAKTHNTRMKDDMVKNREQKIRTTSNPQEREMLQRQELEEELSEQQLMMERDRKEKYKNWHRRKDEEMRRRLLAAYRPYFPNDVFNAKSVCVSGGRVKSASLRIDPTISPSPRPRRTPVSPRPASHKSDYSRSLTTSRMSESSTKVQMTPYGLRRIRNQERPSYEDLEGELAETIFFNTPSNRCSKSADPSDRLARVFVFKSEIEVPNPKQGYHPNQILKTIRYSWLQAYRNPELAPELSDSKNIQANWSRKYDGSIRPRTGLVFVEPRIYGDLMREEKEAKVRLNSRMRSNYENGDVPDSRMELDSMMS